MRAQHHLEDTIDVAEHTPEPPSEDSKDLLYLVDECIQVSGLRAIVNRQYRSRARSYW